MDVEALGGQWLYSGRLLLTVGVPLGRWRGRWRHYSCPALLNAWVSLGCRQRHYSMLTEWEASCKEVFLSS